MNQTDQSNFLPYAPREAAHASPGPSFVLSRGASTLKRMACMLAAAALLLVCSGAQAQTSGYAQTNIISDGAVPATQTNPLLINPWGVSIGPQLWIDSTGSGYSLVDEANGSQAFTVVVPPARRSTRE